MLQSVRRNWDASLALVLVYSAVTINLGAQGFFLAAFLHGCGYLIHTALKN